MTCPDPVKIPNNSPPKLPLRPTPINNMLENGISQFMQFRQAAAAHANAQADLLSRLGGGRPAPGAGGALPRLPPLPLPFPFLHAMAAQQQKFQQHHPGLLHPHPPSPPPLMPAQGASPGAKNNNNNTISPSVRSPGGGHSPTNVPNFQDVRARLPFPPPPTGVPGASAPPPGMSPLQNSSSRPPAVSQASPRSNSYPDEPMSPNGKKF